MSFSQGKYFKNLLHSSKPKAIISHRVVKQLIATDMLKIAYRTWDIQYSILKAESFL
jgi:hypothetical protein